MLAHRMSNKHYFRKENKASRKDTNRKSIINTHTWSSDSLYQQLDIRDKLTTVSNALSYSRKSKNYISRNLSTQTSQKKWIQKHENEWHRKFTLPFACVIFFLLVRL